MKLLELIVRNVKRENIHPDANYFVQDWFISNYYIMPFVNKPKRALSNNCWLGEGNLRFDNYTTIDFSDDGSTTVITREELMRAYDLVEQGYTLWFGGECPVDDGVMVDIVYPCGEKESDIGDFYSWENSGCATDIIAYRISIKKYDLTALPLPSIIKRTTPSSPILCDLMRDISNSMPEMMAADMIDLADYLIAQGWGKHE